MIGIYKITNQINGKVYIGQSTNIKRRWRQHQKTAYDVNNKDYEKPLYRAIRKYGIENFIFEILEECLKKELNEKEKRYISLYNSFFNGYNLTLGGDASGTEINKTKIIGIIHDLETTDLYHREIAEKWNISTEMVQGINTGRYWRQDREYPIQKISLNRHGKKEKKTCKRCGKEISQKGFYCVECAAFMSRIVERPSREVLKNLIRTKSFLEIGRMYGVSDSAIRKWCDYENLPRRKHDISGYTDEEWALI